ncbi:amino acid ABC transporter permease [Mesorhizobium sp.]|uniref:amino acid ABC transporter permease n=1 Tax=Mesorhizobium sp. TaxID=1871066 RepID=UPI00122BDA1A|nr:ABC transporter permease subunit [Mesorhizobium sp.]TIX28165.1 MAG: ABC transporter permease subunit [Mesorhizobium sp.]
MASAQPVFTDIAWTDLGFLAEAILRTLAISAAATGTGTVAGVAVGCVLATIPALLAKAVAALLDVFRSVPLIIQLVLFDSFVSIVGLPLSAFTSGTIVLSAYCCALVAFLTKAGIDSIPAPLRRAARSLGMSSTQEFIHVAWPIGLRAMFPSWLGIALSLLKDSSLVSVLGYVELIRASRMLITRTQEPFLILTVVGLIFFLISYPVARLGARLERRWQS